MCVYRPPLAAQGFASQRFRNMAKASDEAFQKLYVNKTLFSISPGLGYSRIRTLLPFPKNLSLRIQILAMLKKISTIIFFAAAAALCLSSGKESSRPSSTAQDTQIPTADKPAPVLAALGADGRKILLAHMMPWYETPAVRGHWGFHWSGGKPPHDPEKLDENGLPDIRSHFHPLIGLYDSTDPNVIECQLLQMKIAGINGVIADWYGIASINDFPSIHEATGALFKSVGKQNMKFAVCYEDRTIESLVKKGAIQETDIPAHLKQMATWLNTEWFPAPQYFRFNGRPAFFALHHLWKSVGADGGFSWVHTEPFKGEPPTEEVIQKLKDTHSFRSNDPLKSIPSAYPGYKDIYEKSLLSLDRRDGRTMRETIRAAMEGPWPVIQLVTWNDYGEGTVIEPTHETGYTDLEIIQEARRKEMGEGFTFTKDDLRLPARLLALRQRGTSAKPALDAIAAQLASGQCSPARAMLDSLEKNNQLL